MAENRPSVGVPSPFRLLASSLWRMMRSESLTKRYNASVALDNLTSTVQPGEVFCLLGANGAGKTTAINLFLTFGHPTSGTATIRVEIDLFSSPLVDDLPPTVISRGLV